MEDYLIREIDRIGEMLVQIAGRLGRKNASRACLLPAFASVPIASFDNAFSPSRG